VMLIKRLLAPSKFAFLPAIVWTFLILYLCFKTIHIQIKTFENADKLVHFSFYFGFVFLWFRYLFFLGKDTIKYKIILVTASIAFGILIEWAQGYFTTTRSPDFFDVLANSIGSMAGIVSATALLKKR
jgi:VanZ family protein